MQFIEFYKNLISLAENGKFKLLINGKEKEANAMAEYFSVNGLNYLKIVFSDKSFLYISSDDKEVYYSESYFVDTGIKDEEVGFNEIVEYKGKKYFLDNKDDYQFVKKLFFGILFDIEGEVKFSDYLPEDGKDMLSLGWITYNNRRGDINPTLFSLDNISFIK